MTGEDRPKRASLIDVRDRNTDLPGLLIALNMACKAGPLRRNCAVFGLVAALVFGVAVGFAAWLCDRQEQMPPPALVLGMVGAGAAAGLFIGFILWLSLRGAYILITQERFDLSRGALQSVAYDDVHRLTVKKRDSQWEIGGRGAERLLVPMEMFPNLDQAVDVALAILHETPAAHVPNS